MFAVLAAALAIWFIGRALGAPTGQRWMMIALLYVVVLMVQVALPDGHPLRVATGGAADGWLVLGILVALFWAYRVGLRKLRGRIDTGAADKTPAQTGTFSDAELDRYARHIVLREVGGPGQKALKSASVLVIGAGGLGSPVMQYLAAAGVGTIGVIDDDVVENANLQRQIIHIDDHIGMPKVFSAETAMKAQNPFVVVKPYHRRLTDDIAVDLFSDFDVVIDGSDNFDTRYLANATCARLKRPLISGALSQWEGQVSVFDPAHGGPCYACVFPERPAPGLAPSCAEAGVIAPLPGVVGSMMAAEAVKLITGAGAPLRGEMLIYDALWSETRKVTLKRRTDCPVCGQGVESGRAAT